MLDFSPVLLLSRLTVASAKRRLVRPMIAGWPVRNVREHRRSFHVPTQLASDPPHPGRRSPPLHPMRLPFLYSLPPLRPYLLTPTHHTSAALRTPSPLTRSPRFSLFSSFHFRCIPSSPPLVRSSPDHLPHSQPPTLEPKRGSYPKGEFAWTPEQFDKIVTQARHYKLLFTVSLPRVGAVWEVFSTKVMEYCQRNHIVFPPYSASTTPQTPTALPFVLLRTSPKRKPPGSKLHTPYDDLNCNTFTVPKLLDKSLITPTYPRSDPEFAPHPLLRIGSSQFCCGIARIFFAHVLFLPSSS